MVVHCEHAVIGSGADRKQGLMRGSCWLAGWPGPLGGRGGDLEFRALKFRTEQAPERDGDRRYLSPQFWAVQGQGEGGKIAGLTQVAIGWCRAVANMYACCKQRFSCTA